MFIELCRISTRCALTVLLLGFLGCSPDGADRSVMSSGDGPPSVTENALDGEPSPIDYSISLSELQAIGSPEPGNTVVSGSIEPVDVGGEVVAPVRLSGESPNWSQTECRWGGPILIETVVDTAGRFSSIGFLKTEPPECLQRAILEALETWRFEPAERHGEPVAVRYRLTFHIRWQ